MMFYGKIVREFGDNKYESIAAGINATELFFAPLTQTDPFNFLPP